jgi:hypothetical protein
MSHPMTAEELLVRLNEAFWEVAPEYAGAIGDAMNEIHELLARVAELEALTTPRPIEDAPEKTRVLVFCPEDEGTGYVSGWVIGERYFGWEGDMRLEDGVQPTHWLPLPPDPTQPDPTTESEL